MKVILLAPTPPPIGGIAMWTMRMMNAKLKNNWTVDVVDEKVIGKREVYGDNVKRNLGDEVKRCLKIWVDLFNKLSDKDVKVVHSCIPASTTSIIREIVCALITKLRRRAFIVHFRCTVPNMVKTDLNKIVLKWICNLSDCVMVLNKQSEDYVNNLSSTRTELIPNFIEIKELETSHKINEKIERVLYVGGVIESKGCLDLIELAKYFTDIEFRLIGNYESQIKKAADSVNNVVLLGAQPHEKVHDEMMKADVFAFIGSFPGEGFSNALAEAMACGLPCLVSDWAANKDMIEDKGGIVIPVKDIDAAKNAIELMDNPRLREKQSSYNMNKVKNNYSEEIVLNQYVDCYERTI